MPEQLFKEHGTKFVRRSENPKMRTYLILPCYFAISLQLISCCNSSEKAPGHNKNNYSSVEDTLFLPFDTARVLKLYDIKLEVNELNKLKNEIVPGLESNLDTLELTYQHFACDCPNWCDVSRAPVDPEPSMSPLYRYYIEPASLNLNLTPHISQCRVRLIGRHYAENGLPKNVQFTDPDPTTGNVFRYYAYEILLPSVIWGPLCHTGKREIPSDPEELIMATQLTIKK